MLVMWSDDNFSIRKPLGSSLCGLSHNNLRPNEVIISYDEFLNFLNGTLAELKTKKEYLIREFISNQIIITIA